MQTETLNLRVLVNKSAAEEAVSTVVLSPDGNVESLAGRWVIDADAVAAAAKAMADHGVDVPIDFEHQTLGGEYAAPNGQAPAAGWIKAIRYAAGEGMLGDVEWTESGRSAIRSGAYKYLSPVVIADRRTKRILRLHSAALTNRPAIPRMDALAATDNNKETKAMAGEPAGVDPTRYLARIAEVLGVEDGDDDGALFGAILEAVRKLKGSGSDGGGADKGEEEKVAASARTALGLSGDADAEAVTLAINATKTAAGGSEQLAKELAAMKERMVAKERADFMQPYIAKGVIDPNTEDRKEDYAVICRAYDRDPKDAQVILDQRVAALPPAGRVVNPEAGFNKPAGRAEIIANAARDFDADESLGKLTNKTALVNLRLQEAGQDVAKEEELAGVA